MNHFIYGLTGALLSVSLSVAMTSAHALNAKTIKKETAKYIMDIKYPQDFGNNEIDKAVTAFINTTQKGFINELSEDADTPADAPGKTSLYITYSIPYQSTAALSIRYNISIYHKGAAHPSNTVDVQNFINGQKVELADLFIAQTDYLKTIADFSSKAITAKNISDANWIKDGTKPTLDNYGIWSFNKKGINILFNSYQVAAYVYGEQTISIPLSVLTPMLKPELLKVVWGN